MIAPRNVASRNANSKPNVVRKSTHAGCSTGGNDPVNQSWYSCAVVFQPLEWFMILFAVLGNLTADILTPELHAELSKVALGDDVGAGKEAPGTATRREHNASEDKPS